MDRLRDRLFFCNQQEKMGARAYNKAIQDGLFEVIEYVVMLEGKESHWILIARRGWREPESGEGAGRVKEGSYPRRQLAIHRPSFRHLHCSREPITSD